MVTAEIIESRRIRQRTRQLVDRLLVVVKEIEDLYRAEDDDADT